MSDDNRQRIRTLNDAFRASLVTPRPLGKCYVTAGVNDHGPDFVAKALAAIVAFDAFTEDIDPHKEHDMVRVTIDAVVVWGKIDYFDKRDPDLGSEDPADEQQTERVMTILLPEEW